MKLTKCIINEQWDALFDELDVDKSGHLDYSEFWAKMAIKNSPSLSEALNQFDVSKNDLVDSSKIDVDKHTFFLQSFEQNACDKTLSETV